MKRQNPTRERHALYANTREGITFRVGKPTTWDRAVARWYRLDDARMYQAVAFRLRWERRWYNVDSFEVRSVDRHGVGLGSERHARAIPVPCVECRRASAKVPAKRLAARLVVA